MLEFVRQPTLPEEPVAWLFRAVRFRAINLSRSEARRTRHEQRASEQKASWFVADPASGLEATDLKLVLASLPVLERELIIARVWGGLTLEQISELVNLSTSSVHRRYAAALQCLQEKLESKPESTRCQP